MILLEFRLETAKQGKCIGSGTGKTGEYLVLVQAANLFRGMLDHRLAQRNLAISCHDYVTVPADTKNCGGANQSLGDRRPRNLETAAAGLALRVHTVGLGFSGQQLAKHELQNAAMGVVLRFLGSIDTHQTVELSGLAICGGSNRYLAARGELLDEPPNTRDFEYLIAGQAMGLRIFSGQELQRKNSHANEIGAMDALVALRNHGADTQQERAFRR